LIWGQVRLVRENPGLHIRKAQILSCLV